MAAEIHQMLGRGQAQLHHGDQAMAAGQRPRVLAEIGQHGRRPRRRIWGDDRRRRLGSRHPPGVQSVCPGSLVLRAVQQQLRLHDPVAACTNCGACRTKCVGAGGPRSAVSVQRSGCSCEPMLRCKTLGGTGGVRGLAGRSRPAGTSQPGQPAAADRHGVGLQRAQVDQAGVAHPLQADDAVDVDDVAAVDADEAARCPAATPPRRWPAGRTASSGRRKI